jgi:glycerol-3-phosphate dehydrogenase
LCSRRSRERGLLCENAPHLVHHLEFIVPIYSWWEGPFYGIGMKIYDRLAGKLGLSTSRVLSREETLKLIPTLEPAGLQRGGSDSFPAMGSTSTSMESTSGPRQAGIRNKIALLRN